MTHSASPASLSQQDVAEWAALGYLYPDCGNNAAVIFAHSPEDDLRNGSLSQDFGWPGGSMYLSFNGMTSNNAKGVISLLNEDTGMIVPVDPNFRNLGLARTLQEPGNPTVRAQDEWAQARYVYNLPLGHYRFNASASAGGDRFGWFAIDDVNVHQGWFQNECDYSYAPGLVPAQVAPQFPTPMPYTPIAPTEWMPWPSPTPLSPAASETPFAFVTVERTPIAPEPDYAAGVNILRNGSFESFFNFFNFWHWNTSRWTLPMWPGGVEDLAYADLDMGAQPPALSQHFDMRATEAAFVSLWSKGDSHYTVAIREAPTGIFKAIWRIDTAPGDWLEQDFLTPVLPIGHYSIEITNIYKKRARVDEVAITVRARYPYPVWYPGLADESTAARYAQQTAMANLATGYAIAQQTENAQATQYAIDHQTQVAAITIIAQTAAVATQNAAQRMTSTALMWQATQTQLAIDGAAAQATAQAQQNAQATEQEAIRLEGLATQQASRATQTAVAAQTQLFGDAQATVAAAQTSIYQTMNAPAALTQTAIAIIATAQAPFYATQTALAEHELQLTRTAQGTPAPTEDTALATQQALQVPNQPEPYWAAICGRPPNSLNLAWWMDYEVCRILSWFAWSPVNTVHVQTWLIQLSHYEPFGMIQETLAAFNTLKDIVGAYDWNNTGADCASKLPNLADLFPSASGILTGNFQFTPGDPIDMNCATPIRGIVGDVIADGVCGAISILCQHGLLSWMQYIFDAILIIIFVLYIQAVWIEKATQG